MATFFKNKVVTNVGTTPVQLLQTSPSIRATVIGLSITNLTDSFVYVSVLITDETSTTGYYIKDTIVPANTSLRLVNQGEKLIIAPANEVKVSASVDNAVDCIISYVEIT